MFILVQVVLIWCWLCILVIVGCICRLVLICYGLLELSFLWCYLVLVVKLILLVQVWFRLLEIFVLMFCSFDLVGCSVVMLIELCIDCGVVVGFSRLQLLVVSVLVSVQWLVKLLDMFLCLLLCVLNVVIFQFQFVVVLCRLNML